MGKKKKGPMSRSENMSRVHNKNTKPEIYLRKLLWHQGFRYRTNFKDLPGKPDILMKKYRTVIFVNGCFWHMHDNCKASTIPSTNKEFWEEKLNKNKQRDLINYNKLNEQNYKVVVVWECTLKKMVKNPDYEKKIMDAIIKAINGCKNESKQFYEF